MEPKKFKPVRFNISELIGRFAWSDWINFVDSDWVRDMTYRAAGDWGNYIKAAMLRLQHGYQDVKIRGVNMALSGGVPIAAGLSSSSTIVVATLQAAIALNNFELTSEDHQRVERAQLWMQPGSYACSTPEIDQMADVAAAVPGVAGAQIAGAGLGGCIMVLARKESVGAVRKALIKHYYRPAGLKPAVIPCIGVEGAGLVEFS